MPLDPAVILTQRLLQVPSVTAINAADRPACMRALTAVAAQAAGSGAVVTVLPFEGGHDKWGYAVDNIYVEWTFGAGDKHLCYLGHVDVVPVGDKNAWTKDPFAGKIAGGYIHGRGATDMKGSVAAFVTAIEQARPYLEKHGNIKISMVITADEEWAAVNGTQKVLSWMKEQGRHPDAFIVGEPSSQDRLGSHIKTGRRGSLCGTFNVAGRQGHAAYQELFENPNRALALAIAILSAEKFTDGNDYFPHTNFEAVAVNAGNFNASAIIPATAEMLWNIRYTPAHTPDTLEQWIHDRLHNPPDWARAHPDFPMLKNITVTANKDTASPPYYRRPDVLARAARDAIVTTTGLQPVFDGSGGTTDGRFAAISFPAAEIIECGLPERGGIVGKQQPDDYRQKGGMHQIDERASLRDIANLRKIFQQTVINYDRSKKSAIRKDSGKNTYSPR